MTAGEGPQRVIKTQQEMELVLNSPQSPVSNKKCAALMDLECIITLLSVLVSADSVLVVFRPCKPVRVYTREPRCGLSCS